MRLKRFFSAVLSSALLVSFCACAPKETAEGGGSSASPGSVSVSEPDSSGPGSVGTFGASSSEPAVLPPPPEYDKGHRLDTAIPALVNGLEMPINGATGYTSVELPLWPEIPEDPPEPEPAEAPSEPETFPDEPPEGTDPSVPAPGETADPTPGEPAEPDPGEAADSTPGEPAEPDPGEAVDPIPGVPAEPDPGGAVDPIPGEPAEPDPGGAVDPIPGVPAEPDPGGAVDTTPDEFADPNPGQAGEPAPELPAKPVTPASPEELDSSVEQPPEPVEPPDPYEGATAVWAPGTAFVILREEGEWWYVSRGNVSGWIQHCYCMINLPDVIPSILYDDTNAYSSLFVSCGKEIPGVTGKAFYNSLAYNARLGREEFMMPMLYAAARHICAAQHRALAEGNCLVIYQTFRPYDTQRAVVKGMSQLSKDDPEVKAGISTPPWSMTWFINTGISNHQRGYALDVSMVKAYKAETKYIGSRPFLRMTDFEDYAMPTAMHELSIAAISTLSPNSGQLSETMNEPAIALREYFTASGLSPLPSEWWHFNDNAASKASSAKPSDGRYFITECLSRLPE